MIGIVALRVMAVEGGDLCLAQAIQNQPVRCGIPENDQENRLLFCLVPDGGVCCALDAEPTPRNGRATCGTPGDPLGHDAVGNSGRYQSESHRHDPSASLLSALSGGAVGGGRG